LVKLRLLNYNRKTAGIIEDVSVGDDMKTICDSTILRDLRIISNDCDETFYRTVRCLNSGYLYNSDSNFANILKNGLECSCSQMDEIFLVNEYCNINPAFPKFAISVPDKLSYFLAVNYALDLPYFSNANQVFTFFRSLEPD
jgi:hypothetical protein